MAPIKKAGPRSERKAAKRKAQDAIPDVPEDYTNEGAEEVTAPKKRKRDDDEDAEEGAEEVKKPKKAKKLRKEKKEKKEKEEKKEKKPKKEKKLKTDGEGEGEGEGEDTVMADATPKEPKEEVPKKSKKERKAERKAQQAAQAIAKAKANRAAEEEAPKPTVADDGTETSKPAVAAAGKTAKAEKAPKLDKDGNPIKKKNNRNREKKRLAAATAIAAGEKAPARFIVFVGNLPFSATVASITAHFAAVHPVSVRNLTQKDDPTKSKGCAFVEFEGYDHMKTCLKTYHHSEFDDGKSAARKINVELTAGGGGNTKVRKGKIAEKNEKLTEQRTRRIGEEEKQKLVKRGVTEEDQSGIHPSRRARVA